jgi:hypothetical protein
LIYLVITSLSLPSLFLSDRESKLKVSLLWLHLIPSGFIDSLDSLIGLEYVQLVLKLINQLSLSLLEVILALAEKFYTASNYATIPNLPGTLDENTL